MSEALDQAPPKDLDDNFRDWEGHIFGFGYGTGEEHTIPALKAFFAAIPEHQYDYRALEAGCGAVVAWLLINALCKADVLEYGTSPRFGWLTERGHALKAYIDAHDAEWLYESVCNPPPTYEGPCYPDACNCGPSGYEAGRKCPNPFWDTTEP